MLAAVNDLAGVLTSVAVIIAALALLAIAIGVLYSLTHQRKVSASIDSRLGHLELGVNGVTGEPDDPPLVDKVRNLERGQQSIAETLDRICGHLAIPTHTQATRNRKKDAA